MFLTRAGDLAARLGLRLRRDGLMLCVAESCTGGLIAAACTETPGSSTWFCGGVISYSNELKTGILQVPQALISEYGAVSLPVARAMALGARLLCGAQCALAVSGIAGPDGGSPAKPVGAVCLAAVLPADAVRAPCPSEAEYTPLPADGAQLCSVVKHFSGTRREVRLASALYGLELLLVMLGENAE